MGNDDLKSVIAKKIKRRIAWLLGGLIFSLLLNPVLALDTSVGELGINAQRLHASPYNLTGRKIAIGQVEIGRPAKFGLDKISGWNRAMNIAGVFFRDREAEANMQVDEHADMVATVMISQDKQLLGVAPDARLYSAAVGSLERIGQPHQCLSTQHIALQNGGDVRAINYSFGESLQRDPRVNAKLDGNALLTQCVDWSARVHNVLYAIAGNQGNGGIPIPTDNYNGISIAYTTFQNGSFQKVDFANLSAEPEGIGSGLVAQEINTGKRRAISLVAPGSQIKVLDLEGKQVPVSGTSFAAPHLTATVALLQEYGDREIVANRSDWSIDSRQQEVMKAILLNGADKVADTGDGNYLGMDRTIFSKDNRTWLESDAYQNENIPLDIQMGTGHLNAFRSYEQFSAGQWNPDDLVPAMGWDYHKITPQSDQEYIIEEPLKANSFAAITLAWNRLVELEDTNDNKQYDLNETFRDRGLNNLDVYLLPVDSDDFSSRICASRSAEDSVEHIFCQVPETGRYKIRVHYRQQVNEEVQPYALAWWTLAE